MRQAKKLLELLTQEFPVKGGVRHSITLQNTLMTKQPDKPPAVRLVISLWFPAANSGGCWISQTFCLDEIDYDKTPEKIVEDIKAVHKGLEESEGMESDDDFQDKIRESLGY